MFNAILGWNMYNSECNCNREPHIYKGYVNVVDKIDNSKSINWRWNNLSASLDKPLKARAVWNIIDDYNVYTTKPSIIWWQC